jgi:hypothetical protein
MDVRITRLRLAFAGLLVLAGVGLGSILGPLVGDALATVGSVVNISDDSSSAFFAKVDSSGALKTTALVTGKVSPAAPAAPWSKTATINGLALPGALLAGPSLTPINLTSLSLSTDAASGNGVRVTLYGGQVPSSSTNCSNPAIAIAIWQIRDLGDGVTPLSFTFPTPLQLKPTAGFKACLYGFTTTSSSTSINAVGFSS